LIYISKQGQSSFLFSLITHTLILFIYSLYKSNTSTMLYSTFFALGLATAAAAITVTAPSNSTGWTSTGAQVIEWDVSLGFLPFFPFFLFVISHERLGRGGQRERG
jgi:hypothetical protein